MFEDDKKEINKEPAGAPQIDPIKALRRVKFYKLSQDKSWDDKGTGYVSISDTVNNNHFITLFKKTPPRLSMTNEFDSQKLFDLELDESFSYKIQHDTIIVWKSKDSDPNCPEDDSAISFQIKDGLIEICKSLNEILGKDPKDICFKEELSEDSSFELTITNLPYIAKEIRADLDPKSQHTLLSRFKENECDFFKRMGVLLEEEEKKFEEIKSNCSKETNDTLILNQTDTHDISKNAVQIEHLRYIFTIYKNIFQIADSELVNFLMSDELYLITFGALEYDFESQKMIKHRQYFNSVKFNNFLNITSNDILDKIHANLRLAYLRDTAMGRFIEESTSRIINSIIQMNNNDIMQFFLGEKTLIERVISRMKSENCCVKKEAVCFMLELINCSRDVYHVRMTFVECLCECGIIQTIQSILFPLKVYSSYQRYIDSIHFKDESFKESNASDCDQNKDDNVNNEVSAAIKKINVASIEILTTILFSSSMNLKNYIVNSNQQNSNSLLMVLCQLLITQENFGVKFEISLILTTLLDSEIPDKKSPLSELLFDHCFIFLADFLSLPYSPKYKNEIVSTKQIIIEIFSHCTSMHSSHIQYWFTHNKILPKVLNVFNDKQKVLNLSVIKLVKAIIKNNDYNFNKAVLNSECFNHIITLFNTNKAKDNLIFSSIMDLLIYISINCRKILEQCLINYSEFFYNKSNRACFREIIARFENPQEEGENNNESRNKLTLPDLQFTGLYSREMTEKEDEDFFNSNDYNDNENDFEENFLGRKTGNPSNLLDDKDIKEKEEELLHLSKQQ